MDKNNCVCIEASNLLHKNNCVDGSKIMFIKVSVNSDGHYRRDDISCSLELKTYILFLPAEIRSNII